MASYTRHIGRAMLWLNLPALVVLAMLAPVSQAAPSAAPVFCLGFEADIVGAGSITGGPGADVIVGSAGADTINGGGGDDLICGLGGNDTIEGGAGNDRINGNDGADTIKGGAGADGLDGEAGNDTIKGGADADALAGGIGTDKLDGGDGGDKCEFDEFDETVTRCESVTRSP
jgi:hypothetical protein